MQRKYEIGLVMQTSFSIVVVPLVLGKFSVSIMYDMSRSGCVHVIIMTYRLNTRFNLLRKITTTSSYGSVMLSRKMTSLVGLLGRVSPQMSPSSVCDCQVSLCAVPCIRLCPLLCYIYVEDITSVPVGYTIHESLTRMFTSSLFSVYATS